MTKDSKSEHFFIRISVKGIFRTMDKHQFIEWCISEADVNGDGSVSYEEFKTFVHTHPSWADFQIDGTLGKDIK
jgi:hypothetical protein